ncbi:DNA repair protein RAD51 homolog 4-like isoform X9 [Acipenser ruthenus]|uniref:DNA repair protein RAD51 homolog 4-like isoform X9 n=1 Tax=Acipenser ruthenus TaxID=7906 RepID=UPI00145AC022|nr:DNA repair protein RAD51 homolog 4-like isoform X9 [Acipenser ruthenus]
MNFVFFSSGRPGLVRHRRTCSEMCAFIQDPGCSKTCSPGSVHGLPNQWSRSLRRASQLHSHTVHWEPQVCLGVAVSVACDLKRNVLYIDSTGGLSASHLLQMVQSKACKMEEHMEALRRIQVRQVFSVFSLFEAQQDLRSSGFHQVAGGSGSVKVVIVDSVAAVLSPIIGSRQTEGLSLMMQLAGELRTMARDLGVAVLVTNHMTRDGNWAVKAGLGRSWSHVSQTRVLLQRVEREGAKPSGLRTATLVKSSRQPSQISQEFDLGACNQPQDLLPAPRDFRKINIHYH